MLKQVTENNKYLWKKQIKDRDLWKWCVCVCVCADLGENWKYKKTLVKI